MSAFVPPPYPYERLDDLRELAQQRFGEVVDCSIGTPTDSPSPEVVRALAASNSERGYPRSVGSRAYRMAAANWLHRELGVTVDPEHELAACIGTKEFVVSAPHYLRLRDPSRDTVLYPAVSYPSYAMGAVLAGCRAVPVALDAEWRLDLASVDPEDAARALCLWVNSPGNPAGGLDDLEAVAHWGRTREVLVISDECYLEFTWRGPRRTILSAGSDGVLSVHSLSKRSNLAGIRAGFYAGDQRFVRYLSELRKHAGALVAGPIQHAAVVAWDDQGLVEQQRRRYQQRLGMAQELLSAVGITTDLPDGSFYLWAAAPAGDSWGLARNLAERCGVIVSPGEFYGAAAVGYVRLAAVAPTQAFERALNRVASGAHCQPKPRER
ncbi:MAG: aminotransferase class I/II-fold pyridoxal phosphate-dependent enzyme [Acidimicrobiia bacterium]|nr:aminotransferase class I/II-fold pyridoxal phosphate-dependent enzyme [Acidimicrobiia bacterium]